MSSWVASLRFSSWESSTEMLFICYLLYHLTAAVGRSVKKTLSLHGLPCSLSRLFVLYSYGFNIANCPDQVNLTELHGYVCTCIPYDTHVCAVGKGQHHFKRDIDLHCSPNVDIHKLQPAASEWLYWLRSSICWPVSMATKFNLLI